MSEKPNIILITVDCLRPDHLGFMGYRDISPNLDKLARESVVFKEAFAVGPSTPYSFPGILTSTYPLDFQGPKRIKRPRKLISEVLKEQGYITAAFHSNPRVSEFFGYNLGWDFFEDVTLPSEVRSEKGKIKKRRISAVKRLLKVIESFLHNFIPDISFRIRYLMYKFSNKKDNFKVKASYLNQIAEDFIEVQENKPLFVWLHYMDVHGPYFSYDHYKGNKKLSFLELVGKVLPSYPLNNSYVPLNSFIEKHIKDVIYLYDQGIKYVDEEIGKLIDYLKEKGLYNKSIIIITADHGDELWDHGHPSHGNKLYNELLRVPLIIKIPGREGEVIDSKVSQIDLATTICDLIGIKEESFKGGSLFSPREFIFHQTGEAEKGEVYRDIEIKNINQCKVACQSKEWKYILNYDLSKEELYNLLGDPKEKENIIDDNKEIALSMKDKIKEFERENPPLSLL